MYFPLPKGQAIENIMIWTKIMCMKSLLNFTRQHLITHIDNLLYDIFDAQIVH